jgi:transposase
MGRPLTSITNELVEKCEVIIKQHGRSSRLGRIAQAIASAKELGTTVVAKAYNISRMTLLTWTKKLDAGGVENLSIKRNASTSRKLTEEQLDEIRCYILDNGANLTAKMLIIEIKKRFDVTIGETTAYRIMGKQGFSHQKPRPEHYKKNWH